MGSPAFQPLWTRVAQAISQGRLQAPEEVRREIEAGQDELVDWIGHHGQLFVPTTPQLVEMTANLVHKHRELAGLGKTRVHADPWVVALAIIRTDLIQKGVVVADESPRRPTAMPSVCQAEGIDCLTHVLWFEREGWAFG